MPFTPSTKVHLCTVPFDKENNHVIRFGNSADQFSYFSGKIIRTLENYTYQRRDNVIKANVNIDVLENINYVFYNNLNFTNKWFYAFVTKLEYISENVTNIYIETDVWQTWAFDVTFKQSFVVREHITTDTVGVNLIDENLNFGEYVLESPAFSSDVDISELCILVASSVSLTAPHDAIVGGLVGGIYAGCGLFFFENDQTGSTALNAVLASITSAGKANSIVYITTFSRRMIYVNGMGNGSTVPYNVITATRGTIIFPRKISGAFMDFDGEFYTPKNKKLYCYPYNYVWGTNNQGGTIELRYELWSGDQVQIDVQGDVGASPSVMLQPMAYKGNNFATDYGMTMRNYPQCSWATDIFKNWVGQNLPSIILGGVASIGALGVGLATMNPIAIGGGAMAVAGQIGNAVEKSVIPPNYQGSNKGGSNCSWGKQKFEIYNAHIRNEYLHKLDDYFEQFGYKTNDLKLPNLTGRPIWNYVQLIDPNITGDIPSNDMQLLKTYFTRGITLWHTTTGFLDYSLNNH